MGLIKALRYARIRYINKVNRIFNGKSKKHQFLFIFSPPYCGSTMLNELVSTSINVSNVNPYGNREGKYLPGVSKYSKKQNRWKNPPELPWEKIKNIWFKYWDQSKTVLLEKSPMHIMYGDELMKHFLDARFIIMYRNPYAHCQGMMKRYDLSPIAAAEFVINCLNWQKSNIEMLPSIYFSYEELTSFPEVITNRIVDFIPELGGLDYTITFNAHNQAKQAMKLTNLNQEKIKQLSQSDIDEINTIFNQNIDLLEFFGYTII